MQKRLAGKKIARIVIGSNRSEQNFVLRSTKLQLFSEIAMIF